MTQEVQKTVGATPKDAAAVILLRTGTDRTNPELFWVRRSERITAATLHEQLATSAPPVVLDVRTPREWQSKHIAGSLNIPLNQLPGRWQEVPRQGPLVLHCQSGYRSAIAASLLERHGITTYADLVGGFAAWEASQLAVVGAEVGSA